MTKLERKKLLEGVGELAAEHRALAIHYDGEIGLARTARQKAEYQRKHTQHLFVHAILCREIEQLSIST